MELGDACLAGPGDRVLAVGRVGLTNPSAVAEAINHGLARLLRVRVRVIRVRARARARARARVRVRVRFRVPRRRAPRRGLRSPMRTRGRCGTA